MEIEAVQELEIETEKVGPQGYSAYEVAVQNGYEGTETEWLASLKGEDGTDGEPGPQGPQGLPGENGTNATINGVSAINIVAGENITLDQEEGTLTINSTGGGTRDYTALTNKPSINNVELNGNKSLSDLGAGTYDKPVSGIPKTDLASDVQTSLDKADSALQTHQDISGKQDVLSSTNKLSADYVDDTNATNKFVTASEKSTWNSKSDFSGDYNDLTNKPTIPTVPTSLSSFTDDLGSSPTHTHSQYLTSHQDISGKQDTMQFSTMPTPSIDYLGKIVQYTGTTNANYTNGYFYIEITDGAAVPTYSWSSINVQKDAIIDISDKDVIYLAELQAGLYYSSKTSFVQIYTGYENEPGIVKNIDCSFGVYFLVLNTNYSRSLKYTYIITRDTNYIADKNGVSFTELPSSFNVLTKTNTQSYTPTSNYHPATKKYVDDSIAAAITTTLGGSY